MYELSLRKWVVGSVALLCCAVALAAHAAPSVTEPGPESAPVVAPASVVAKTAALFPQAKSWFAIVADARFRTLGNGALVPILDALGHSRVRFHDGAGHGIAVTFPRTFRSALRVGNTSNAEQRYVTITPLAARNASAVVDGGLVVYADAYVDTDVLYKATPTHLDEYLLLRSARAPTVWTYALGRGKGIARLRQAGSFVEAVDERGRPWLRASRPVAMDRSGKRVYGSLTVSGALLRVEIDLAGLQFPVLVDPDWKSTGDMAYGRFFHRFNELPDGRVLATGGCSAAVCSGDLTLGPCRTVVRTAEMLDLQGQEFSVVGDSAQPRYFHVAESLPSGKVLVAGGCTTPTCAVTASAERFDATAGTFTAVASLPEPGAGHAAVLLDDGRLLVAGGCDMNACTKNAFAFDEKAGTWTKLASLATARGRAGVSRLPDGRVLLTGGCTTIDCKGVLASAEVYDPSSDTWLAEKPMSVARAGHYQAALPGGRVLVGGGCADQTCTTIHLSTELFDPSALGFKSGPDGQKRRYGAVAVSLPNGDVMISQGCSGRTTCDLTNELYDSADKTLSMTAPAVTTRAFHAVLVHSANLVIANGGCQPGTCSWWNEYYDLNGADGGLAAFDGGVIGPRDGGSAASGNGGLAGGGGGAANHGSASGGTGKSDGGPTDGAGGGCGCSLVAARGPSPRALGLLVFGLGLLAVRRLRGRRLP